MENTTANGHFYSVFKTTQLIRAATDEIEGHRGKRMTTRIHDSREQVTSLTQRALPNAEREQALAMEPMRQGPYIDLRSIERGIAKNKHLLGHYALKHGLVRGVLKEFKNKGHLWQIADVARALGIHPSILFWLTKGEEISSSFQTKPLLLRDWGHPPRTVPIGAVEIPPAFSNLFVQIDEALLKVHHQPLIRKTDDKIRHGWFYTYAFFRRENPPLMGAFDERRFKKKILRPIAETLGPDDLNLIPNASVDAIVQGLKIFCGYYFDARYGFLYDRNRNLVIGPNDLGLTLLFDQDGIPQPYRSIAHYTDDASLEPIGVPQKTGLVPFLDQFTERYGFPGEKRMDFFERHGASKRTTKNAFSELNSNFGALNALVHSVGGNPTPFYWARYGRQVRDVLGPDAITMVMTSDHAKRRTHSNRSPSGVISMPRGFCDPTSEIFHMLRTAWDNKRIFRMRDSRAYRAVGRWKDNPLSYHPQEHTTYDKVSRFLFDEFRLEGVTSLKDVERALRIAWNWNRIRDYLPVFSAQRAQAFGASGLGDLWFEGEGIPVNTSIVFDDHLEQTNLERSWRFSTQHQLLLERDFRTRLCSLRENRLTSYPVRAVEMPGGMKGVRKLFNLLNGLTRRAKPVRALLEGRGNELSEWKLLETTALLTKHPLRTQGPRKQLPRQLWMGPLLLMANHDSILDHTPIYDPSANTYEIPPALEGRFKPIESLHDSGRAQNPQIVVNDIDQQQWMDLSETAIATEEMIIPEGALLPTDDVWLWMEDPTFAPLYEILNLPMRLR